MRDLLISEKGENAKVIFSVWKINSEVQRRHSAKGWITRKEKACNHALDPWLFMAGKKIIKKEKDTEPKIPVGRPSGRSWRVRVQPLIPFIVIKSLVCGKRREPTMLDEQQTASLFPFQHSSLLKPIFTGSSSFFFNLSTKHKSPFDRGSPVK